MCIYVTCSFAFQSIELGRFMDTNIDDILCHGDRMYLHARTNEMVPDANSLSIEELPEVATSQNNVECRLNYNKFYQGGIDRSVSGDGPFCLLKQVLINAFSDSSNAMLVTAAVLKFSELDEFKSCRNFGTLSEC